MFMNTKGNNFGGKKIRTLQAVWLDLFSYKIAFHGTI